MSYQIFSNPARDSLWSVCMYVCVCICVCVYVCVNKCVRYVLVPRIDRYKLFAQKKKHNSRSLCFAEK